MPTSSERGQHERLVDALLRPPAAVVASGYPSPMYDEAFSDWYRHTLSTAMSGASRTEIVWCNTAVQPRLPFDEAS